MFQVSYDNGNESTCCNFTSMFQSMFSSMFSSMFTRDRGFIFILTNIFEILKIYLGNFWKHTCNILIWKNINPRSRVNILENILENIL